MTTSVGTTVRHIDSSETKGRTFYPVMDGPSDDTPD